MFYFQALGSYKKYPGMQLACYIPTALVCDKSRENLSLIIPTTLVCRHAGTVAVVVAVVVVKVPYCTCSNYPNIQK